MIVAQDAGFRAPVTIRSRLLIALAIALAPVLVLGIAQTATVYSKDVEYRRIRLVDAAQLSAATAQARISSGAVLLETLTSETTGLQCGHNLNAAIGQLPGYESLIRFDAISRISCASDAAPQDLDRRNADWFVRLKSGAPLVVVTAPQGLSRAPAILAAVRADKGGNFDGAMAAVIDIASLRPDPAGGALPAGSEIALIDSSGAYASQTRAEAFPATAAELTASLRAQGSVFEGRDRQGGQRLFALTPMQPGGLEVVLSAPTQTLAEWSRVHLLATIAPPVLAFLLAVLAVWFVADRVVVRWLNYLQRIAAIYAKGRLTVRAVRASEAPPEIAELAATLDNMADAILERDASLTESLAEKDRLMREIHHRVKNNLQVISSMVSMQQRAVADPVMRETLDDIRQRIAALALIYRTLYQGPNLQRVDLKSFLEDLTAQLVMSEAVRGHAVDTQLTADHLSVDPDRLAPLALFAVEAITNAQKHAFHGRGGALLINFSATEDTARLEITDSGAGDPKGALERVKKGVGGVLMSAFARQLGGAVAFSASDVGGLTAVMTFPVADPNQAGNQKVA